MAQTRRMADFLTTLRPQSLLTDGAMGSYLFESTGRLSETGHVYEAFNLNEPSRTQALIEIQSRVAIIEEDGMRNMGIIVAFLLLLALANGFAGQKKTTPWTE